MSVMMVTHGGDAVSVMVLLVAGVAKVMVIACEHHRLKEVIVMSDVVEMQTSGDVEECMVV